MSKKELPAPIPVGMHMGGAWTMPESSSVAAGGGARLPSSSQALAPLADPAAAAVAADAGDLEAFIQAIGCDARAAQTLRMQSPEVQQYIMQQDVASTRNPSATVISRIQKYKNARHSPQMGGTAPVTVDPSIVEMFILEHELDDEAAQGIRSQDPSVQQAVLDGGPLTGARNKTSAIFGRINKAKMSALYNTSQTVVTVTPEDTQKFIFENGVDERAAAELMSEDPVIQQAVLNAGSLAGAPNKSAALIGRIHKAKLGRLGPRGSTLKSGTPEGKGGGKGGKGDIEREFFEWMMWMKGKGKGGGSEAMAVPPPAGYMTSGDMSSGGSWGDGGAGGDWGLMGGSMSSGAAMDGLMGGSMSSGGAMDGHSFNPY